ncbi:alpha-ketoglutarate-dependent dioxygenase AlkB family protein [Leptospira sp. GIMC2001]|uniref:alpha-ketoglutarate-dependent dioxygenase AlkB family protein n=1 Tax=Leptospira sp. GIMC2001 TaxID=1513297 RepID=UPI00234947FC|nr:alpha-ketoglutarate-dependent dioxygenase AlkB [Leptospira sp. GIMC2001]WCL49622.1 alpha-ketoglutarate-dependent dioxygenase AlkB [Leptospira sp. GIMC2001]
MTSLFPQLTQPHSANLLTNDGAAFYYGKIFTNEESKKYLYDLTDNMDWKHDELIIFGKKIITKRKVAWYGSAPFSYTYSHTTKFANPWTEPLILIKSKIEKQLNRKFNSCLLNFYHDGNEGMSWHSDDETSLEQFGCIASVSFGAERRFDFRNIHNKNKISIVLENGSLMTMEGECQKNWQHSLPKSKKVTQPRINLTFRKFIGHLSNK